MPLVLVGGLVIVLVSYAALAIGFPVRQLDLNDTGIWVSNDNAGQFGRVNKAARALDSRVSPPGVRVARYQLDIIQDGNLALGWDQSNSTLTAIDTALGQPLADRAVGLDASNSVVANGGTLAVMDRSGRVWATRYDRLAGVVDLAALAGSNPPLASLGLAPDVEVGSAALTVSAEGKIYLAGINGRLISIAPKDDFFAAPTTTDGLPKLQSVAITVVGDSPVLLDATGGQAVLPGGRVVPLDGADATTRLQQPGPAAEAVLVATTKGLLRLRLDSAQVIPVHTETAGAPASPVRLGGCDFGAWAGIGRVVRSCDGGAVEPQLVEGGLDRPAFRQNHGLILLNDQTDGTTYDLDTRSSIDWPQPKPPVEQQEKEKEAGADTQPKPKANDDNLWARQDRTTVLHVLDNDTDTVGGVLTIQSIEPRQVPQGTELEVSPDGQTVKLFLPEGASTVAFDYTVSDGSDTDTGHVVVNEAGARQSPPALRPNYSAPRYTVPSFGTLSIPVVSDWRDPEGDPVTVIGANAGDGTIVPVTPDGQLSYTAEETEEDQDQTLSYEVTDGADAKSVRNTLKVRVLGKKSTTTVSPVAQPDSARGEVGKPISVFPLNNDTPGADPRNLNAKLTLSGQLTQKAHLKVTTDEKSGRITVVADQEGPYFLEYSVSFGNSAPAKGSLRIDALAAGKASGPVAMPDQAAMRGVNPVLIDVLANDYDPAGNLLTVQAAAAGSGVRLQVQVVQGRWLRILGGDQRASGSAQAVHYTVTNGSQSAEGDVLVTQLDPIEQDVALPRKDTAVVRAGDSVLIPVLTNDSSLSGQPLKLVTDGLDTDADGKLAVLDRAKKADEDQGDAGSAYVRGDQIRYVAPATVAGSRQVVILYTAQTAAGDAAESQVVVTIKPEPSADDPDAAPVANTVEMRVVSGSRVRIAIPTSGQDPDGDTVIVTGIASAPELGRVVAISPNSITYEAYPTAGLVGTDTFRYQVADKYGRTGIGTVRVAVAEPGQTQPPVAIDDALTTKPGAEVQLNLMANDFIARDDAATVAPLNRTNNPVPADAILSGEQGPLQVRAPELIEQPVLVNYALTGNGGTGPVATVKIMAKQGFNNPPTVVDQVAEIDGASGKANLLGEAWDVDGPLNALKPALAVTVEGASLVGGELRVPLRERPQVIPYTVTDSGGAVSAAVVYVPAAGAGAPQLKVGASIDLASNATASFGIADFVESPRSKAVRIASAKAETAPGEYLDGKVDDSGRFTLTSKNNYVGPASVTLDVMDGASQTDDGVLTATVTIPVQVGAPTPVLRCPEFTQTVVQGGEIKNLDITSLCHVWSPDPESLGNLTYAASWEQPIDQVSATGGEHRVKLQAAGGAPDDGEGVLRIGIEGTAAATATLRVKVVPADAPQLRSVNLTDIKAGTPVTVPISLISPLLDAQTKVLETKQTSGGKASVNIDQASVTITPAADTSGKLVFRVKATDLAADPGRDTRWADGTITMTVYSRPDAPSAPRNGPTVQSHAATLAWTPGNANGAAIDSYQLKIASGPGSGRTITCRSAPCQVTGLTNGAAVTFQVRAHNKADWSDWSSSSAQITPDVAPGAPAWVQVSDPQDHSVLVSWGKIANDGSAIKVIHVTAAGTTHPVGAGKTSLRVNVPSNNDVYTFSVAGENDYAIGPAASDQGQSSGKPAGLSVAAPNPGAAVGATTNVTVSWSLSSPEGPTPVSYDVARSDGKSVCANVTRTSCVDDTVRFDGTSYTYLVTATNATGGAAHSASARSSAWAAVGTPDNWSPTAITAAATGDDGEVRLTYTVPASRGGTSKLTLLRDGSAFKTLTSPGPDGGASSYTATGLTDGTSYSYSLRVCNEANRCSTSPARSATSFGPLAKPNITSAYASGSSVTAKGTANGNGASATLILYIDGQEEDRSTGRGSLNVSGSRTVGYSNTVTVRLVLNSGTTTPHRSDPADDTASVRTPARPTVTLTVGEQQRYNTGDPQNPEVYYYPVYLAARNFVGSYTCHVPDSWPYDSTRTFSGNVSGVTVARLFSYGGPYATSIRVTCDGIASNTVHSP
ncbi:Ig-like domain-containing protein [Propionicimonas sp.]|uniref:Ig-like domain-containing protein n=1 Tax=Propionicimonas sp. TaxID=1955623 RepID=UPI00181C90F9|nr:Ig-like domain-containing protein [Propionicimonas sp.]MBU3976910.1 hypothetical protein [Actinomycetota bacterium]MBA3019599.1 fibronectin type III domain-containing protein [Propionicimonas sp.]MBU3987005.1 hypothetical protein [Actinomycetota bacterium]MBU4006917.1 hypothetical protein [Actinomycetota bacterium]MBU4065617.1 hypothetical protein [Actinomycetota bacterium]